MTALEKSRRVAWDPLKFGKGLLKHPWQIPGMSNVFHIFFKAGPVKGQVVQGNPAKFWSPVLLCSQAAVWGVLASGACKLM